MTQRNQLQAVMDEDLRDLLKSIGELEAIDGGKRFCRVCGTLITTANLQIIVPQTDGSFDFICDKPECVEAMQDIEV